MHSIELMLIMLLAVVVSSYLGRTLPFPAPLPLVQIALGVLLASVLDSAVELDSELFLFAFLPPLLFLDGWRIPKASLFHDKLTVIGLAFGLVIFTVFGAGLLIYCIVPGMPLPVAFALAAVVSPTDPVAVSSIVSRCPMPKRMMHVLEGESLLNDASGLVCFRFAVVAAATGLFSAREAAQSFLWMVAAGLAIGIAVTWSISDAQHRLSRIRGEESGAAILINLMTPFGAYLAAEYFEASGILAAVAAGITMSYIELSGRAPSAMRVQRTAVWDMARFSLNGLMFVLLGEQLPGIVSRAMAANGVGNLWADLWLGVCALLITAALTGLRGLWIGAALKLRHLWTRRSDGDGQAAPEIDPRIVPVMSLAGVRGAVTLAGVMSLPLVMKNDASPFPARDEAIFLAAMVILLSLLAAGSLLPRLLRGEALRVPEVSDEERREDEALREAAESAIRAVEKASLEAAESHGDHAALYSEAASRVIESYQYRLAEEPYSVDDGQTLRDADRIELQLRQAALKAERDTIARLAQASLISDDVFRRLMDRVDFLSVAHHPETHH